MTEIIKGLLNLFNGKLATLFDKLRIASPVVYLLIIVLVFGGAAVLENFTGLSEEFPWLFDGVTDTIIEGLVAILLSSRTKRHIPKNPEDVESMAINDIDHDD